MKKDQQTLFDATPYELTPKFTKQEKTKWTKEFVKFAEKDWMENASMTGHWCCGYMGICDKCNANKEGCKSCIDAVKEWFRLHNKKINYRDLDFKKIMSEIEGVEWEK